MELLEENYQQFTSSSSVASSPFLTNLGENTLMKKGKNALAVIPFQDLSNGIIFSPLSGVNIGLTLNKRNHRYQPIFKDIVH